MSADTCGAAAPILSANLNLPSIKHAAADLTAIAQTFPATVIRLPSADGQPIQQHPSRGRRPTHVLSLWRARFDRSHAATVLALDAQIALALEMRSACNLRYVELSNERREIQGRCEAMSIEYDIFTKMIKDLEARRAQAAKGGAA